MFNIKFTDVVSVSSVITGYIFVCGIVKIIEIFTQQSMTKFKIK